MTTKTKSIRCPNRDCNHLFSRVSDSRATANFISIRRRRICLRCDTRWTTYEIDSDKYTTVIPFLDYADRLGLLRDLMSETLENLEPYRMKNRNRKKATNVQGAPKSSNLP